MSGWAGQTGAQITPLFEAHKDFVLGSPVLHADETTVKLLNPGAGKTKTAYMWAYARGVFDPLPGVVYDLQPRPRRPVPLQVSRCLDRHPGA